MYFFIADEHMGHANIIEFCNRPFSSVKEMDEELIKRHNEVVTKKDIVIHGGDYTLWKLQGALNYIKRLNGSHIFLKGSHDKWLKDIHKVNLEEYNIISLPGGLWEKVIDNIPISVCHYAMRTWHRSHYNSWQFYGHSHGNLPPIGKQWDIGVDNNNFYPVSFEEMKKIMETRPDNPNLVKRKRNEK